MLMDLMFCWPIPEVNIQLKAMTSIITQYGYPPMALPFPSRMGLVISEAMNLLLPTCRKHCYCYCIPSPASGTATVRVIGPEMIAKLAISPERLKIEPGQSASLSLQVRTYSGETFDLQPVDVIWSVDSAVGQIVDGKFTAGQNTITGLITATFQGLTATVPVTVQPPWQEVNVNPEEDTSVSMDDWVEVRFLPEPPAARLNSD
ncbi:MAG: hypothetical protein RQM92_10520 [Candidatus Syntrophopropionicum ammoniitolerans]